MKELPQANQPEDAIRQSSEGKHEAAHTLSADLWDSMRNEKKSTGNQSTTTIEGHLVIVPENSLSNDGKKGCVPNESLDDIMRMIKKKAALYEEQHGGIVKDELLPIKPGKGKDEIIFDLMRGADGGKGSEIKNSAGKGDKNQSANSGVTGATESTDNLARK